MDKPLWLWASFIIIVLLLLAFDLGILNRKDQKMTFKKSAWLSVFYICIAICFGIYIDLTIGDEASALYFTGYIVEKTLSLDNIFVISLIFGYFRIPEQYQHRVLFWGIFGVIVLRAILIGLGSVLINEFHWILYIFAAFLVFTGIKMLFIKDHEINISENSILKFLNKNFKITKELHGHKFFVKMENSAGKKVQYITPLFVSLVIIEFVDLVFAVDSIPAIFAITTDPFIIYTSNIFAILGLRALYFCLASMVTRFEYLKPALAVVLVFIGSKVFISEFLLQGDKFPTSVSVAITLTIIFTGVVYSLVKTSKTKS